MGSSWRGLRRTWRGEPGGVELCPLLPTAPPPSFVRPWIALPWCRDVVCVGGLREFFAAVSGHGGGVGWGGVGWGGVGWGGVGLGTVWSDRGCHSSHAQPPSANAYAVPHTMMFHGASLPALGSVNRDVTPWIIVCTHRSVRSPCHHAPPPPPTPASCRSLPPHSHTHTLFASRPLSPRMPHLSGEARAAPCEVL
jgi:hypothetical protein